MTEPAQPMPAPSKAWWKKKKFYVPGILLVLIIAGNASGGSTDRPTTSAASTTTAPVETQAPAPTKGPATKAPAAKPNYPGAKDGDKVAAPGNPIELSGWSTTATPLKRTNQEYIGKRLCSTVTLVNRDNEQQEYSPLSWKLQAPNGQVLDTTYSGGNNDLDSSGLAPGGKVTARVCFEEKGAGPGLYVLAWQPDIFSSEDRGVWPNRL